MSASSPRPVAVAAVVATLALCLAPHSHGDNSRLNNSVVANVYTARYQGGCVADIKIDQALTQSARWQARDLIAHPDLTGELGSDGSTPQTRSAAAGFRGSVRQVVATNPSLAINNLDVITQWFSDPVAHEIVVDCANVAIGVWSENSLQRSVVVAVLGRASEFRSAPIESH